MFLADIARTLMLGPCRWCLVLYASHVIYVWFLHFVDSDGSLGWRLHPIKSGNIYISAYNQVIIPQHYDYRRIVIYSLHPFILLCITFLSFINS